MIQGQVSRWSQAESRDGALSRCVLVQRGIWNGFRDKLQTIWGRLRVEDPVAWPRLDQAAGSRAMCCRPLTRNIVHPVASSGSGCERDGTGPSNKNTKTRSSAQGNCSAKSLAPVISSILPYPPCLPPVMLSTGRVQLWAGGVWPQGVSGRGRGLGRGKGVEGGGGMGHFIHLCHILHYHMVLRPKGTSHNENVVPKPVQTLQKIHFTCLNPRTDDLWPCGTACVAQESVCWRPSTTANDPSIFQALAQD